MATTVETGARSTFLLSYGAGEGEAESDLYVTAMYELKLANVERGSTQAKDIEVNYTALARGACVDCVRKIRGWKVAGKLREWEEEDRALDVVAADGGVVR